MMLLTLMILLNIKLSGCDHFTKSSVGILPTWSLIWLYVVALGVVYTMNIHHIQHIAFFTLVVLPKQIFQIDLKTSFQCSNKDETGFYILTKITRWRPNCKILQTNIKVVISPISSLKIWWLIIVIFFVPVVACHCTAVLFLAIETVENILN